MENPKIRTKFSPSNSPGISPYRADAVFQVLADNPELEFNAWGIAEKLGSVNVNGISKDLIRMAGSGKGSRQVKKTLRGFYQFSKDPKEPLLDQIRQSGSFGIENLVFSKKLMTGANLGDTLPQILTTPKVEFSQIRTMGGNSHQIPTKRNGSEWSLRHGFPWQFRTGQKVEWWNYPTGTEMIVFSANGSGKFSLDLVLHLIDKLRDLGLDNTWEQVSREVVIDNKQFTISEPITFQVAEKQLLKFYQHGNMARLEAVNRKALSFEDAALVMAEMYERSQGRQAIKRVTKIEDILDQVMIEQKRQGNYVKSLSNYVHGKKGKQETLK
jgi:hypothetical protein